jgi:two-component system, response regulator
VTSRFRGILLVEDNSADVEFIVTSLRACGLADQVRVARDGVEALETLGCSGRPGAEPTGALPRLVILDIKLPRLNGFEVLQQIREHPGTRQIPVVIFTSSNIARDIAEGYRLGANSYVQKPVEFERFREVVRQLGTYWLSVNEAPDGAGVGRRESP